MKQRYVAFLETEVGPKLSEMFNLFFHRNKNLLHKLHVFQRPLQVQPASTVVFFWGLSRALIWFSAFA